MANKKRVEQNRRLNIQLPGDAYDQTERLAAERNQSVSEFVRRAVDFQAWLEKNILGVEGFSKDELAKIQLAHDKLRALGQQQEALLDKNRDSTSGANAGVKPESKKRRISSQVRKPNRPPSFLPPQEAG